MTHKQRTELKLYGRAFRAALAVIERHESDTRTARDQASACGAIAVTIAKGSLGRTDLTDPDDPAMVAALEAAPRLM